MYDIFFSRLDGSQAQPTGALDWARTQERYGVVAAGTTQTVARIFSLIALERLVSRDASRRMMMLLDRTGSSSGRWTASFCAEALKYFKRPYSHLFLKVGAQLERGKAWYCDAAAVLRDPIPDDTTLRAPVRYVAVGLGIEPPGNYYELFRALDNAVLCSHALRKDKMNR